MTRYEMICELMSQVRAATDDEALCRSIEERLPGLAGPALRDLYSRISVCGVMTPRQRLFLLGSFPSSPESRVVSREENQNLLTTQDSGLRANSSFPTPELSHSNEAVGRPAQRELSPFHLLRGAGKKGA